MDQFPSPPLGFFSFDRVLDPETGTCSRQVLIEVQRAKKLALSGHVNRAVDLRTCREVLSGPEFVCQGLKRDGQEGGLCYVGQPDSRWNEAGQQTRTADDDIFLVVVSSNWRLIAFRWELLADGETLEDFCKNRFERILWPTG